MGLWTAATTEPTVGKYIELRWWQGVTSPWEH